MSQLKPQFVSKIREMRAQVARQTAWSENHGEITPSLKITLSDGTRLASAGNALWKIDPDETWHGFIYDLLRTKLGVEWFDAELARPEAERHILVRWYEDICHRELDERQRFSRWVPAEDTGTTLAYRSVAYDAFCLMQAMSLTPKLLARLRHRDQFEGARYELWVAAALARAGFSLELLDEDDRSSRHGELVATHQRTSAKFWIEAKRRTRKVDQVANDAAQRRADVQGLVADALSKPADHPRIIFIDVNLPPWAGGMTKAPWLHQFRSSINKLELQPAYRDRDDLSAFIMATNHPYHYTSDIRPDARQHFIGTHFNMPKLDLDTLEQSQPVVMELMRSITRHFAIPDQFL